MPIHYIEIEKLSTEIVLKPTLEHCIETVAKKELSRIRDGYLEGTFKNEETEEKIELLNWFLQSMDFRELRRTSEEYLIQGKSVRFNLYTLKGKPSYKMLVD